MNEAIYMMLYTVGLSIVVSFAVASVIWIITKIIELASGTKDEQAEMDAVDEDIALVVAIAHAAQQT